MIPISRLFTKQMKRLFKLATLMLIATILITPSPAYATEPPSIQIAQEIQTKGQVPEGLNKSFTYVVQPQDPSSDYESIRFTLTGNETFNLPVLCGQEEQEVAIQIHHAGVYKYNVYLAPNEEKTSGWKLDSTEYLISLDVRNTDDGLSLQTVVIDDGQGYKPDTLKFTHSYAGTATDKTTQDTHLQIFGLRLPATGDPSWGFIYICALVGTAFLVLAATSIASRKAKLQICHLSNSDHTLYAKRVHSMPEAIAPGIFLCYQMSINYGKSPRLCTVFYKVITDSTKSTSWRYTQYLQYMDKTTYKMIKK